MALYAMTLFEEPGADYTVNGLIQFPVRDGSGAYCLARHGCCTWGSLETGPAWRWLCRGDCTVYVYRAAGGLEWIVRLAS